MIRFALAVTLLVTGGLPFWQGDPENFGSDSAVCADVKAYFASLDRLMLEGMAEYFTDEEWLARMERSSRKANASDSGMLVLGPDEMQPMIDILTVPGDVLLDYPEEDIPELVQPLHESATSYLITMPAMLRSVATGGIFAALVYVDDLEATSLDNAAALLVLEDECPTLVAELEEGAASDAWDDGPAELGEFDIDDLDDEEIQGFAFGIMTLPAEEAP